MISTGLFLLLVFLSGFWLSRTGKPYHAVAFNIHKLIALGAVIILAITVFRVHQAAPPGPAQITAIVVTGLCFAATIVTGGLLSIGKPMPAAISVVHHVFPYLTILATAGTLYLLLAVSSKISTG